MYLFIDFALWYFFSPTCLVVWIWRHLLTVSYLPQNPLEFKLWWKSGQNIHILKACYLFIQYHTFFFTLSIKSECHCNLNHTMSTCSCSLSLYMLKLSIEIYLYLNQSDWSVRFTCMFILTLTHRVILNLYISTYQGRKKVKISKFMNFNLFFTLVNFYHIFGPNFFWKWKGFNSNKK